MSILSEVGFGTDGFGQPEVKSRKDSIAQIFVNLFTLRKGNIASLPNTGIDITRYLYSFEDELDEEGLKKEIFSQCSDIVTDVAIGEIQILMTPDERGQGVMLIVLPLIGDFDDNDDVLIMAFKSDAERLIYNYKFTSKSPLA